MALSTNRNTCCFSMWYMLCVLSDGGIMPCEHKQGMNTLYLACHKVDSVFCLVHFSSSICALPHESSQHGCEFTFSLLWVQTVLHFLAGGGTCAYLLDLHSIGCNGWVVSFSHAAKGMGWGWLAHWQATSCMLLRRSVKCVYTPFFYSSFT